jgi:membrane associated rhomboid family serine protease
MHFTHKQHLKFVFGLFVLLTAIELINLLTGRTLNQFGNIPRTLNGLIGIGLSPFLHGSIAHYLSNILPLCLFSYLLMQYGFKQYVWVSVSVILFSGLLVWLLARPASHIGASGLVYGYFGFLVLAGFMSGKFKLILISVIIAFFYGGLIWGVLPTARFISWESHLFGLVAGLWSAYRFSKTRKKANGI